VTNLDAENHQSIVENPVNHAPISLTHSVFVASAYELFAPDRPRVSGKGVDTGFDPRATLDRDLAQLLCRRLPRRTSSNIGTLVSYFSIKMRL